MRLWNGWGEDTDRFELGPGAEDFLRRQIGEGRPRRDLSLDEVLATVPASRVSHSSRYSSEAQVRLRHARGQSFPDWLAMRSGEFGPVADAVALPASHEEAAEALAEAQRLGAMVIPYGGGTSVVGHLQVPRSDQPVLNISLERMNRLMDLDERAQLARFGAGTPGPQIEAQLQQHGALLGHFPQSYTYSTVGGWVVTRSSGQQSMRYGRIEQLFAGGRLLSPQGELRVGGVPASAAGPDLRELVMGSEGRLGLLTEVNVRIRRLPECEDFHAVFFPDWDSGLEAVRAITQAELPLSMLRLSNELETETQLQLSGHEQSIKWLQRYLGIRGISSGQCMLVFGATGSLAAVRRMRREALALAKRWRGIHVGKMIGKSWQKNRFRGPLLRNSLWERGYAADTVETAINWPAATGLMRGIEAAARQLMATQNVRLHAFTHLSHVYRQGCSIYSTFVWPLQEGREADLALWRRLKAAVSEAIVAHGGTISHQHGVGVDHAPYLQAEKGELGLSLIRAAARELDPAQMMNPGKLFS